MKNFYVSRCLKGFVALFLFAFLLFGSVPTARAEVITDRSDTDVMIEQTTEVSDADMAEIMSNISDREMSDGDSFISGNYQYDCEVIIDSYSATESLLQSNNKAPMNALASTLPSTSADYTATCNIYVTLIGTTVSVVTITHTITVLTFETGQIHISYGSLSATPHYNNWSVYVYGYSINNTNGSYSSSWGYTRLYNSYTGIYTYYKCFVSITPGNYPTFAFTQVG